MKHVFIYLLFIYLCHAQRITGGNCEIDYGSDIYQSYGKTRCVTPFAHSRKINGRLKAPVDIIDFFLGLEALTDYSNRFRSYARFTFVAVDYL